VNADQVTAWLDANWLLLLVIAVTLFLVWRFARPLIHRAVFGLLSAQERAFATDIPSDELTKRAITLEELLNKLVRLAVIGTIVLMVFGVLNLWSVVAGLGLFLAALTVAGQSIILDYLMGILILVEAQYFKGDTISVGGVEGVVEEVGLRRTVIRDSSGTVHSISNGTIRLVSNLTRVYAVAVVDVVGIRDSDVQDVIAIMDRVGQELADDPEWTPRIQETPRFSSSPAFTDLGVTLRMTGKVRADARWSVAAELRRRLAIAFSQAGLHPNRRVGEVSIESPSPQAPAPPTPVAPPR
jgi:small conductance mechanosensitive channel